MSRLHGALAPWASVKDPCFLSRAWVCHAPCADSPLQSMLLTSSHSRWACVAYAAMWPGGLTPQMPQEMVLSRRLLVSDTAQHQQRRWLTCAPLLGRPHGHVPAQPCGVDLAHLLKDGGVVCRAGKVAAHGVRDLLARCSIPCHAPASSSASHGLPEKLIAALSVKMQGWESHAT